LTLVLGGARSGKSTYAEQMAAQNGGDVLYIATATASDDEMATRIQAHRAQRPANWRTLEAPTAVGDAFCASGANPDVVVLDCLTLLTNNVLFTEPEPIAKETAEAALGEEIDALLAAYDGSQAEWIVVSNEVGLGLVPPYPLGRIYRDALGRANQRLAAVADAVLFMVAGLPMKVK